MNFWDALVHVACIVISLCHAYLVYQHGRLEERHARFLVHYNRLRQRLQELEDDPDLDFDA